MQRPSASRTALATLLALLGVGAAFLTWERVSFLGAHVSHTGWDFWEGIAAACLFAASAACFVIARQRPSPGAWHPLGYALLPLTTVGLLCWYAWRFVPPGVRARIGSDTRLGAGFREIGSVFKSGSIGAGAYAALALAVSIMLLGYMTRTRE
jgi:hypothetical protein